MALFALPALCLTSCLTPRSTNAMRTHASYYQTPCQQQAARGNMINRLTQQINAINHAFNLGSYRTQSRDRSWNVYPHYICD